MSTRFEGAHANDVRFTVAQGGEEIGVDVLPPGIVALCFNYDEVFYVQGTQSEVGEMLDRARDVLNTATAPSYPEHEKLATVATEVQAVLEFIHEGLDDDRDISDETVYSHWGIDYEKIVEERKQMVAAHQDDEAIAVSNDIDTLVEQSKAARYAKENHEQRPTE